MEEMVRHQASFNPNDESGDGVGYILHSWVYDPSQRLFLLRNGKEKRVERCSCRFSGQRDWLRACEQQDAV